MRLPSTFRALLLGATLLAAPAWAQDEAPPAESSAADEQLVEEASQAEATEIQSEEAKVGVRARAILDAVEDFRGMRVEVEAGIVALSGSAPTSEAVDQALGALRQLDGVLLVVEDVRLERGLSNRLEDSWSVVLEQLRELVAALPLLGAALAIVAAFWLLARLLRDVDFLYRYLSERALLQELLRQTVFVVVLVAGVVAALRFVDAGGVIGTILGAAGVVGIALGFAFRNIVENYLAGVLLAVRQPFRARDVVEIEGRVGTILTMTASETTLLDADGNHVRIPNAAIFNGNVVNFTRNHLRRFTLAVGVGNGVDLPRALELGVETLRKLRGVVADPAPSARVVALGDSSVLLELYGWVDQTEASHAKVASEAHRAVKESFDREGIDMPPPEYALRFETPPPAVPPAAVRRAPARPAGAPAAAAAPEVDVSPESDTDEQVERELSRADEANLLDE